MMTKAELTMACDLQEEARRAAYLARFHCQLIEESPFRELHIDRACRLQAAAADRARKARAALVGGPDQ